MQLDVSTIVPWAIFGCITALFWAVTSHMSSKTTRASERLEELRDPRKRRNEAGGEKATGMGAVFASAAPALSKALQPKTEIETSELKVRLANAGYSSPNAAQIFLACKVTLLAV